MLFLYGALEQISPEILQTAKTALSLIDPEADDLATAVMLARHEPAFKGSALIPGRGNQFAERLAKIPDTARARWATTSGLDTVLATASLVRCDGLFRTDGSFNQPGYDSAFPVAEALAKERRK